MDLPAGLRVAGERAGDEAALGSEPPSRVAGRVRAGELPVFVGRPAPVSAGGIGAVQAEAAAVPSRVRVEVLGRAKTEALKVPGVLMRVDRADGEAASGKADVVVDYTSFRAAYGGNYGQRLRIVRYPACLLTTPKAPGCAVGTEIATRNDTANHQLVAEVTVEPPAGQRAKASPEPTPSSSPSASPSPSPSPSASPSPSTSGTGGLAPALGAAESGAVFAVAASSSSGGGSYAAQPLSSQAEWSTSGGAGDFTWSYPLRLPPSPTGLVPSLGLSYSSAAADGQTAATNNQASWAGLGFDIGESYIQRKYAPCGGTGPTRADLCWQFDNAFLVLNGVATELIRKDADEWYAKKDPGWRIRRAFGGDLPDHKDNDKERWVVTTQDGSQYWFGVSEQPTTVNRFTGSVWTVPVFADNSSDPCWTAPNKVCDQAWRWNLDYVTDRNGNSITYFYDRQFNHYGRGGDIYDQAAYVRGGTLTGVEYGSKAGAENTLPAARVDFVSVGRCAGGVDSCGPANEQNKANYPDVPVDQLCTNIAPCYNHSPTFFSHQRLNGIATYVHNPADPDGWQAVDSYDFDMIFHGDADDPVDPALALRNIARAGVVGATPVTFVGGTWFDYLGLQNRVDVDTTNGSPSLVRHRVSDIYDEFGGKLEVSYGQPHPCSASALPSATANRTNCFPSWWQPENRPGEFGWFNKWPVTRVVELDVTGLSPPRTTAYGYLGTPAWAFHDQGTLVPAEQQSWEQWRGYSKVLVTQGTTTGGMNRTENLYYRGLHGATSVTVTNSRGQSELDYDFLEGKLWESRSLDAANVELVGTVTSFFANKTWDGGSKDSWIVLPSEQNTRTRLSSGAYRYASAATVYEAGTALPLKAISYGEVNANGTDKASNDESCAATSYARNTTAYRFFPARVESRAGTGCAAADPLLARSETFYDGHANLTDAPTNGRPTKTRAYRTDTEFVESSATYDIYGRPASTTDPLRRTTRTTYTPADNKPTTKVTSTNPKGWSSETTLAPWWGSPLSVEDANGRVTDFAYDGIGRLTKVWLPGRPKTGPASQQFTYGVSPYSPNWTKTSSLHSVAADGVSNPTYLDAWSYLNGFGEQVETQAAAPGGSGRIVVSKDYDNRGLPYWSSTPYFNTAEPGTGAVNPAPDALSRTAGLYDALERPTYGGFFPPGNIAKWATTTSYGGDRTTVTPPVGGTKTTIVDAMGRTKQLVEQADAGTITTSYGYNRRGEVTSLTDPKGNVTRYTYNLLGQRTKAEDPDAGTTTYDFDNAGQFVSSTDVRNKTLVTSYDDLGRKAALYEGSTDGTKLAEWTYDTLPGGKGMPASSTSFDDGKAYTAEVTGYDAAGRATGSKITIPAAEGALAGTYNFGVTYDAAGRVATTNYPEAGGLGAETVTSTYNGLGLPATLTGSINQVAQPYVTATSFNELAQLEKRYYGGGTAGEARRIYAYEADTQRLAKVVTRSGAGLPNTQDDRYAYDALGNATRVEEYSAAGALSVAECFSYDKLNRLTQAFTTSAATCPVNPAARTANGVEPYHLTWTHDEIGNRLTETNKLSSTTKTRTYSYPASGDGAQRPHAASSVAVTGVSTPDTFAYDDAGNTAERRIDGLKSGFTWDVFGRLDHADVERSSGGTTVTERTDYVYDAEGNRLLRREPGNTVLYLGGMELRLTTEGPGSGTVNATRYYSHGGAPVAVRTVDGLDWMVNDTQASAEVSVDAATGATTRRRYLPFGGDRSAAGVVGAWPSERGFLNKTKDSTTGLSHLGAREYDAVNGRFLSPDPLVAPSWSQNGSYTYAANNPIAFSDPSGLQGSASCAPGEVGGPSRCTGTENSPPKQDSPGTYKPKKRGGGPTGWTFACGLLGNLCQTNGGEERLDDVTDDLAVLVYGSHLDGRNVTSDERQQAALDATAGYLDRAWEVALVSPLGAAVSRGRPASQVLAGAAGVENKVNYGSSAYKSGAFAADAAAIAATAVEGAAAAAVTKAASTAGTRVAARSPAKVGARPVGCNSFAPGALVLMANGSTKPIDEVEIDDVVLATDPETGKTEPRKVTATILGSGLKKLVKVTIDTDGKRGNRTGTIVATDKHPFWDVKRARWTDAAGLKAGDALRTPGGMTAAIISTSQYSQHESVHNLTIQDIHTYYVIAGATPVLVHNCGDAAKHSVGHLADSLGDDVFFHYTDEAGHAAIMHGGVVKANSKGASYFTQDMVKSGDANNVLFAGNPQYAGRGSHVIAVRISPDRLGPGVQPNELVHQGSFRFTPDDVIYHGSNPFG